MGGKQKKQNSDNKIFALYCMQGPFFLSHQFIVMMKLLQTAHCAIKYLRVPHFHINIMDAMHACVRDSKRGKRRAILAHETKKNHVNENYRDK